MSKISYSPVSTLPRIALVLAIAAYAGVLYQVFVVWHARSTSQIIVAVIFSLLVIFTIFASTTKFIITTQGLQEKAVALKNTTLPWPKIGAFVVFSEKNFVLSSSFLIAILFKILPFRRPVRFTYFVKFTDGQENELKIKLDKRSASFLRQVVTRLHKHEEYFEDPGEFEGKKHDAKAEWARLVPLNPAK